MVNTKGCSCNSELLSRWASDQISDFFYQIMPIARPVWHSGIPSQMPSRSTVSGSGQPGKLRGQGCSWRQSQGCSRIKQNMPLSSRASQHLAPAAEEQINIIVSTELYFFVCVRVCVSPTCFAKLCSPWACSPALPLPLFAHPLQTHPCCCTTVSVVSISFPVRNLMRLKFLFLFFFLLEGKKTTTVN